MTTRRPLVYLNGDAAELPNTDNLQVELDLVSHAENRGIHAGYNDIAAGPLGDMICTFSFVHPDAQDWDTGESHAIFSITGTYNVDDNPIDTIVCIQLFPFFNFNQQVSQLYGLQFAPVIFVAADMNEGRAIDAQMIAAALSGSTHAETLIGVNAGPFVAFAVAVETAIAFNASGGGFVGSEVVNAWIGLNVVPQGSGIVNKVSVLSQDPDCFGVHRGTWHMGIDTDADTIDTAVDAKCYHKPFSPAKLTTTERNALTGMTSGQCYIIYNSTTSTLQATIDGGSTWKTVTWT